MKKLFLLTFLPASIDVALLLARVCFGLQMLVHHGWPKLATAGEKASTFPDPLGIGSTASLGGALLGEVVCSVLLILGLGTRLAALIGAFTMAVAFFLVHGGNLSGPNNGEMAFLYLVGYLVLLFAGAGRFSLDRKLGATA